MPVFKEKEDLEGDEELVAMFISAKMIPRSLFSLSLVLFFHSLLEFYFYFHFSSKPFYSFLPFSPAVYVRSDLLICMNVVNYSWLCVVSEVNVSF